MKQLVILTALICFTTTVSFSQKKSKGGIDYKKLEKEINDQNSPYYYPELMKRYQAHDNNLTTSDYLHLYYGFSYQESYNAYSLSGTGTEPLKSLLDKDELTENEWQTVIGLCDTLLIDHPFDFRTISVLIYACKETGEIEKRETWRLKVKGLLDAILSTGDGTSMKTAIHVISVSDEYFILSYLGYEFGGKQSLLNNKGNSYDLLEVKANKNKIKGLYFNINRIFAGYNKMFGK